MGTASRAGDKREVGQRWHRDESREEGKGLRTEKKVQGKGEGKEKGVSGKGLWTEMRAGKMDGNENREQG